MPSIVLFDIDGTLIRTGRAGSRAMDRAFQDLFGIAGAFDGIQMGGRTDRWILEDAAARAGVSLDKSTVQRFRDRYCERLRDALPEATQPKGVLPGVQTLLETLAAPAFDGEIFVGLLTGNCQEGARIKLEHFDLWRFFRCGGFGDEARDRDELFPVALHRAVACGAPSVSPQEVIVVGDTPLDVACAAAAGARSVAVATGAADFETLEQSGAHLVVRDLSDTGAFLRLL
jgi:phosphoglycolate phosphatase-like HAD superfamily hydrolase